jgi:hypothetical protein
MNELNDQALKALDSMDEIGSCFDAVAELANPDLQPSRESLSSLLGYLTRQQQAAQAALQAALRE